MEIIVFYQHNNNEILEQISISECLGKQVTEVKFLLCRSEKNNANSLEGNLALLLRNKIVYTICKFFL
jgi:hypothetical protein